MSITDKVFLKVDDECFKIVDDRITKLRTGKLSVEGFLLLLDATDPFILIGNTVYVLTPVEYYATRAVSPMRDAVEAMFNTILSMTESDISSFTDTDKEFIYKVKADKSSCTPCKFKKYKESVYRIGKKYNVTPDSCLLHPVDAVKEYPSTKGEITQKVSYLLDSMYRMTFEQRKACIDCVTKHVSQAYVLAQETYMGYPEHISLVYAHLCEAIEEAPPAAVDLIESLKLCLAYSNYKSKAFVPIHALLAHISLMQYENNTNEADNTRVEAPAGMAMDISDINIAEIDMLPKSIINRLKAECTMVIDAINNCYTNKASMAALYKGALACMAERIASTCPEFANMLRNRRLFFGADPSLAKEAGYDFQDVLDALNSKDSADN